MLRQDHCGTEEPQEPISHLPSLPLHTSTPAWNNHEGLGTAKPAFLALSCLLPSLTLHEGVELVLLSSLAPLSSSLTPAMNSSV